jgi:hypothetical protein
MSSRYIPEPSQIDYHSEIQQHRREAAIKSLAVGDVLSVIDDLISQEPAPEKHPCFAMVAWVLDQALTPGSGGAF